MENIKTAVRAHLQKAGEANVKQIARATAHSETEIINALNAMRTYAEVECAQGGRGKGMTYWLTTKTAAESAGGAQDIGTKALREKNASMQTELSDGRAIIALIRSTLGIDDGASIVQTIENVQKCRDAHIAEVIKWETAMMKLVGEDGIGSATAAIEKLKSDLGHARAQIDALNEQLMNGDNGEEAVDIKDAAKGYLVCAPKRKPAKVMKPESAVTRAKSAAKSAGRSEVFALVPVGVATRKQVLAVEFKEKAA